MQDGSPKASEAARQGTLSRQGIPSPSQFHIPETGLGLAQFGQVVTPHPVLCGQSSGWHPSYSYVARSTVCGESSRGDLGRPVVPGLEKHLTSLCHTCLGYLMRHNKVPQI